MHTLETISISKAYGGVQALDDVTCSFDAGKVHCLAGVNGSGKSTLIKIISGVEHQDRGEILLGGTPLSNNTPRRAMRRGIQVIYQDMALFSNLSAAENIDMLRRGLDPSPWISPRRAVENAESLMARLGVHVDPTAPLEQLPIADRQLVAILRALAGDPKVLFMDEPTTALTWKEVHHLFEVVERLKEQGVAIVFVSHKLDEVLEISDEVTVLRNGVTVASGAAASFTPASLAEALVGEKTATDRVTTSPDLQATPALSVKGIGAKDLFADISFDVAPGEIIGLTGLRGAGRTEIAEGLFGLLPLDEGHLEVNGQKVDASSPLKATAAGIAYVPEDRLTQGVFINLPIADNLISADLASVSTRGILGPADIAAKVESIQEDFGIKMGRASDPIKTLSGGNQQKVVLGKWLSRRPQVIVLNGPTVGVDIGAKFGILQLLRDYASQGAGVVFVSDDFQEVASICNRVLIIDKGRISAELSGDEVTEEAVREVVMEVKDA